MSADKLPMRAIYGALPGRRQAVGRAERWAFLQLLRHMPYVTHVITDLASLASEIDEWREDLASSRGQYADIWREVFHIAEQQPRPGVTWCPAHKDAHHYLFSGGRHDVNDFYGNAWADFFAK
eukprot:3910405-Pyramimonas_sp.AAC.1